MAGEIQTTITFANGDQVTSDKLNEIISGASFTADAVTGSTLLVTGGKLKVGTITASEMGADSVSTTALQADSVIDVVIADGAVTYAKVDPASVATEAEIESGTAGKLVDAQQLQSSALVPQAFCAVSISGASRNLFNNHRFASATKVSTTKTTMTFATAQTDNNYNVHVNARSSDGSGTANIVLSNFTTTSFDITHPAEGAPWVYLFVTVFNL